MNQKIYLFLSGGFDSTYLLYYYSIINPIYDIVPIYLNNPDLDGALADFNYKPPKLLINNDILLGKKPIPKNVIYHGRHNKKQELKRLQLILKKINTIKGINFYKYTNKLHNLIIFDTIKLDDDIIKNMKILNRYFDRSIRQYTFIAQILKNNPKIKYADIGSEYGYENTTLSKVVIDFYNNKLSKQEKKAFIQLFGKLQFSLIKNKINKQKMLTIAKKNNFIDILQMSISCWEPNKYGNKCNKCYPCQNRIIKHIIL